MDFKLPNVSLPIDLPNGKTDAFEFAAGPLPPSQFRVISFRGHEAISTPFQYDLDLLAPLDEMTLLSMPLTVLRKPGYLHLVGAGGNAPRLVHGIISAFSIVGADPVGHSVRIRATLVPKIWEMSQFVTSRIFQDMTVADVVTTILEEWNIKHEWRLSKNLPHRTYATQYRESDLQFVSRLLAEEGVFYFFEHPSPMLLAAGDGLVGKIGDMASTAAHLPIAGLGEVKDKAHKVESALMEMLILSDDASMYPAIVANDAAGIVSAVADAIVSVGEQIGVKGSKEAASKVGKAGSAISPKLAFAPSTDRADNEDHVIAFSQNHIAKPEAVTLADYDYRTPMASLRAHADSLPDAESMAKDGAMAAASSLAGTVLSQGNPFSGPGAAMTALTGGGPLSWANATSAAMAGMATDVPTTLTPWDYRVYLHDDRGEDDTNPANQEVDPVRAKMVLEQFRSEALVCEGLTLCRRMEAGHRFTLGGHPLFFLNIQYVITAMRCQGDNLDLFAPTEAERTDYQRKLYSCEFSCAPATVRVRPPVPVRGNRQILETATVVGPPGQQIFVDHHGRIKVQFHWDEEGDNSDHSSCWLRTTQSWSGPGFGSQFIPRVGMEVLVSFLNGNPDRPLVIGCLPNGYNPVPFELPADATRSGWKTQTVPHATSGNELSFEDAFGSQQILMHAARDLDIYTERNHVRVTRSDETTHVGNEQKNTVAGRRLEDIGTHEETVQKDRTTLIKGNLDSTVNGNSVDKVLGDSNTLVIGTSREEIQGESNEYLRDDISQFVKGCFTTLVGTEESKRSWSLHVNGMTQMSATTTTEILSDKAIVLRCGKSSITLSPNMIEILAPKTVIHTKDASLAIEKGKLNVVTADQVALKSKQISHKANGASLVMKDNADLDGKKVNINCGGSALDVTEDGGKERKTTKLQLKNKKGKPIPHARFMVETGAGERYSGVLDNDGKAELDIEEGGTVTFPDKAKSEKA